MGKKYDARKMTELCDTLDHVVERYTAHAEMLENEYEKYNSNNTYRGEAADASKEFVYRGQGKLTKEQIRVLNRLSKKYKETHEYFSSSVDSSPNAKIDTDVIEYDKRYLERQKESFEEKAWQMERVTREMADKFERFGFLTRVNADRARYGFEDMCGYNGFMNKCLRKFEEFDAEMTAHLKQTGLDRYMYDLETDTKATMNALDGMTVYKPDVKKITVTPIAQMASKMMYSAGLQPTSNNIGNSNIEVKKLAKLLNVKCSLDTVVSKSVITKAAELAILDCKTDKDKIAVRKCAASMMAPGVDYLTVESILQEFSEALGPYGVFIKFILIIICVTAFFVENADDIKRNIERVVTPKKKEDSGIIIENPPKEDKKTIIEGPTAVPQKPSVTDIPSGDVKEKEIGRDIMPKSPIEDDGPKITTIDGNTGENPQDYLDHALERQGVDSPPRRLKEKWVEEDYEYEVRIHDGESDHTDAESIYRVSRKSLERDANGQGKGREYLGSDGKWYSESVLKESYRDGSLNPNYDEQAAVNTHIPLER